MNITPHKEPNMLKRLMNWWSRELKSDPNAPCSYDCYDMGGCYGCSELVTGTDPDYGEIEWWERRTD